METLQSAPSVSDAAVFGSALHLVVSNAEAAIPEIKKYLESRSVSVGRIEKIRPSLEDVFVSLTTEPKNGNAAA